VTAFSLTGYRIRHVPSMVSPLLVLVCNTCPPGINWVASTEADVDWQMAEITTATQAHHEQHHRAPHLMDRQVQP
jgi:hypothetical protein